MSDVEGNGPMRIEQLEYFAAVTQHGSLRRAGEQLHISQPALSESLRNLERELGVTLLDRQRSGARISRDGRNLLPHVMEILEAADRLRAGADDQHLSSRLVRVGTVNAGTVPLLAPAIQDVHDAHPASQIEVVNTQQGDIDQALLDGGLDLGLINMLAGDDPAPHLQGTELIHGRPVLCCRSDSRLAALAVVTVDDLRSEPFIAMRTGYVMHRYVHRLFGPDLPAFAYSTDGAEMGKLMVAEGLGVTVLPDYSVAGDPLERHGVITYRRLAEATTTVTLVMQSRRDGRIPRAVRALQSALVVRGRAYRLSHLEPT
jgi:DNA-binding transcriptional LysR family regulator